MSQTKKTRGGVRIKNDTYDDLMGVDRKMFLKLGMNPHSLSDVIDCWRKVGEIGLNFKKMVEDDLKLSHGNMPLANFYLLHLTPEKVNSKEVK